MSFDRDEFLATGNMGTCNTVEKCPSCKGKGFIITDILSGSTKSCSDCSLPSVLTSSTVPERSPEVITKQPYIALKASGKIKVGDSVQVISAGNDPKGSHHYLPVGTVFKVGNITGGTNCDGDHVDIVRDSVSGRVLYDYEVKKVEGVIP